MGVKDLHMLPRVEDSWSFLYIQHSKIDQDGKSISVRDDDGRVAVPCASLSLLMLGPGTSITHAAMRALAENGCMVQWCGEEGVRMYGVGLGETRSAQNLLKQAAAWANPELRLRVVRRMYAQRFGEEVDESYSLQQLRGREGIRVRTAYGQAAKEAGIEWKGREYNRQNWRASDPVNRALSSANSCLYGICHAAIVAAGFSAAIGFIHTGKALSFVYDIADLYKTETSVAVAFQEAKSEGGELERRVRQRMRDKFYQERVLERIVPDLGKLFAGLGGEVVAAAESGVDVDEALPTGLWDPVEGRVRGGWNYSEEPNGGDDPGESAS